MENKFYVYMHIKETDGSPFYIGKGKDNRAYTKSHRSGLWNKYVNKYGFDVIFLDNNLTEEESFEKEKYWINRIGRLKNKTGLLINFTEGGEGVCGLKHTEESRLKMSKSKLGKETWNKGKVGYTGQLCPNSKLILDTHTGIYYYGLKEASYATGINRGTIWSYLSGRNKKNKTTLKYV